MSTQIYKQNQRYLNDAYAKSPTVASIAQALARTPDAARIELQGMSGGQEAFVLAAVLRASAAPMFVYVANDKESAAYLYNELYAILGAQAVFFFPDSFKRPAFFDIIHNAQALQRSELVNQISGIKGQAVAVTYPEALFEKVVRPQELESQRIQIRVGERLDMDFLIAVLVEYGFYRSDFVYEPGQFSVRGGIIDLFSYGNDLPYRIELFDDTVETIRIFDPLTQLSVRNLSEVRIVPNLNTRFEQSQKDSLFNVLPKGTVVWVKNMEFVNASLQTCFENAENFARNLSALDAQEVREMFRDRAFLYPNDILEDMLQGPLVLCEKQDKPQFLEKQTFEPIAFRSHPQPDFNKNFDLLVQFLHDQKKAGYATFIFSENPRQFNRLSAIFESLGAKAEWSPVEAPIHSGFIDDDLRIACLTDHQIFRRHHHYKLRPGFSQEQALNIRLIRELQPGDYVTHIDHGIGRFSGLQKIEIGGQTQEAVRLIYKNNDILYVSIHSLHKISKYIGQDGAAPPALQTRLRRLETTQKSHQAKNQRHRRRTDQTIRQASRHTRTRIPPPTAICKTNSKPPSSTRTHPISSNPPRKSRPTWKNPIPWIASYAATWGSGKPK